MSTVGRRLVLGVAGAAAAEVVDALSGGHAPGTALAGPQPGPLPGGEARNPSQQAAAVDWPAVERALGRPGQAQAGDVFRIGMPRGDLNVAVQGIPVQPGFALGSYAAFKPMDGAGTAMVMGDLVLLDEEVNAVMSGLFQGGLAVTALHNHLNEVTPHVMYLHYGAQGDAVQLAQALRAALSASGTPLAPAGTQPPPNPAPPAPPLDTGQIQSILGRSGSVMGGGVFQVSVPRAETITESGAVLPPAMGVATALNFQPAEGGAATTGDLVLIAGEVNPAARALRDSDIDVTALHGHALADQPRLFYMHFWGDGDLTTLVRGLRAALDQTNSAPGA